MRVRVRVSTAVDPRLVVGGRVLLEHGGGRLVRLRLRLRLRLRDRLRLRLRLRDKLRLRLRGRLRDGLRDRLRLRPWLPGRGSAPPTAATAGATTLGTTGK